MDQVSIVSQNSHFMSFTREFQHEFYAHPDISSFFYAGSVCAVCVVSHVWALVESFPLLLYIS